MISRSNAAEVQWSDDEEDCIAAIMGNPDLAEEVARRVNKAKRDVVKGSKNRQSEADAAPVKTTHKFAPMVPPQITYHPKLNSTQKLVYTAMLTQSKGKALCMASQFGLAKDLRLSVRTIRESISALERNSCLRTSKDTYGSQDSYTLLVRIKQKDETNDRKGKDSPP